MKIYLMELFLLVSAVVCLKIFVLLIDCCEYSGFLLMRTSSHSCESHSCDSVKSYNCLNQSD